MTIRSVSYTTAIVDGPPGLPDVAEILGRARAENFPVASAVLPKESRNHLMAFYGFARLVDFLGDEYAGDRLVALGWLEGELRVTLEPPYPYAQATGGPSPGHPLVVEAVASVRALCLDPQPLFDLVEANRRDQEVSSYETFEDLVSYCRVSANPIGRLVLGAFGIAGERAFAASDAICTGLQLTEHWQDVAEDARNGRIYLPDEDLRRFGVEPALLAVGGPINAELRALMVFQVARARSWLDRGLPLLTEVRGRPRWAVAGFWSGGHAALDAIAARDFDVLRPAARPSGISWARHMAKAMRAAAGTATNSCTDAAS
jgi:squalene synthase HpnC